jgi:hypothetical protein
MRNQAVAFCRNLLIAAAFLASSTGLFAQYYPNRQTYTPPPTRSYTPPPSSTPSRPSYTPPARTYTPPANNGNGTRSYTPSPSAPVHTYTPGSTSTNRTTPSSSGATTYTPHTYTPETTYTPHPASSNGAVVRTENGVTTYTPRSSVGSTSIRAGNATSVTYTPGHSSGPPSVAHASSATIHAVYSVPATSVAAKEISGNSRLTTSGSLSVLREVNSTRAGLVGVNKRPIPHGEVTVHANGNLTVNATNGRQFNLRPNGTLASLNAHGMNASFRGNGRVASLHTGTMAISRGARGQRTIVTERANHVRLVNTGRHSGYLQRTVLHGGHSYIQRTYVRGNVHFSRVYTTYTFHGMVLDTYVPGFYYAPAFYGWAYYPWASPVAYSWGWAATPWFAYYGGYWSPWAAYASGADWLTDYYLSQTLADAYDQQDQADDAQQADDADPGADSGPGQSPDDGSYAQADTPITQAEKDEIAQQVQQQLAYENAAAAQPDQAPSLDDLPQIMQSGHLFVVDQPLNASMADGAFCGLSGGDVLSLTAPPQGDSPDVSLQVVSGHREDCRVGSQVGLSVENLQEMQNNFRAQLDSGLQTLHAQQGQHGLPGAPHSAIAPPPRPAPDLPPDTENVQAQLNAQQQQANQAEASATQQAFAGQQ